GQQIKLPNCAGTTPPPPPPPSGSRTWLVRPGDTLGTIAKSCGVSVSALAQANGITNPNLIYVGQVLRIP
ncbi:MAG: LysM peptidoglycan-binding domain-containing protein, partial [Caldilineaceae bacterium]